MLRRSPSRALGEMRGGLTTGWHGGRIYRPRERAQAVMGRRPYELQSVRGCVGAEVMVNCVIA